MTDKAIRRWYAKNGMDYIASDWGPRDDNGESLYETRGPGYTDRSTVPVPTGGEDAWWWEERELPWHVRSWDEQQVVEALDEFFEPYIAMLPRPKGNIIRQLVNDRLTYETIATGAKVSRQGAWWNVRSAIRALTRLIAEDDDTFTPPEDGRRRDYEAETWHAKRVLMAYLERRFDGRGVGGLLGLRG